MGGTDRNSEFDTIWYLILQVELQAPLFPWYGYDMSKKVVFFKIKILSFISYYNIKVCFYFVPKYLILTFC